MISIFLNKFEVKLLVILGVHYYFKPLAVMIYFILASTLRS